MNLPSLDVVVGVIVDFAVVVSVPLSVVVFGWYVRVGFGFVDVVDDVVMGYPGSFFTCTQ